MKRLSRHTVVVLLVALGVCLGGMSVAVVAFGQAPSSNPDATVPTGDYTGTTPTSSYTVTTTSTTPTVTTTPTDTGAGAPVSTNDTKPSRTHGSSTTPSGGSTHTLPSTATATRRGPSHLAFTGGEPIFVGVAGAGLMLAGLALHRRRQQRPGA